MKAALRTPTFVTVDGQNDGKVKVELGDDPNRTGAYAFRFQLHNLTDTGALTSSPLMSLLRRQRPAPVVSAISAS